MARNLKKLIVLVAIVLSWGGYAMGAGFTVLPPGGSIPGTQIRVPIQISSGALTVGYYRIRIRYNGRVLRSLGAEKGSNLEFTRPITSDVFFGTDAVLSDTNNSSQGCIASGTFTIGNMVFLVLKGAPSDASYTIKVLVEQVKNCSSVDITANFYQNTDGSMGIAPPSGTTTGVTQYLDVDANGTFNYNDALLMRELVSKYRSNTSNTQQYLNIGGLQSDIDGNGLVDDYDVGLMDAMTRDLSWCSTGPNGIAQTTASPLDVQVIGFNFGKPGAKCVSAPTNQALSTTPSGDDQIIDIGHPLDWGNWISTGANGICNTTRVGSDTQNIPVGQGYPYSPMIEPGPDGVIDSTCSGGDDLPHTSTKNTTTLLNTYHAPGRPSQLVKVAPLQEPVIVRQFTDQISGLSVIPPVALIVRVQDEKGHPKVGLAPVFTIIEGTGSLDGPTGGTNLINNVVGDRYLKLGAYPEGATVIAFHPAMGSNTVQASLVSDSTKGVDAIQSVTFTIIALSALSGLFPDYLSVQLGGHLADAGATVPITLTVRQGSTPISGLEDRIVILSSRNMFSGVDATPAGLETVSAIFSDPFESTIFPTSPYGVWTIQQGGSSISRSSANPGMFGFWGLRIQGAGATNPSVIRHVVPTTSNYKIQLAYQWAYIGNPIGGDYFKVEYSTNGGGTWNEVQNTTGEIGLRCPLGLCAGNMSFERRNLWGDEAASRKTNFTIRFSFAANSTDDVFWLDNVTVNGVHIAYEQDFEAMTVGAAPTGFDYVDRITSGRNGKVQTTADAGDVQRIAVNNGEPSQPCVYAGVDDTLQTSAGGDDQVNTSEHYIHTGANGICNSSAIGNDFQQIPLGQGLPFSVAITAGSDSSLTTTPSGDDELQKIMGPSPAVLVDSTVGTTTGGNQGHNSSQKFVKIARATTGSAVASYALRKTLNLAGQENVWLNFWSQTLDQANTSLSEPYQVWVCEVSDNGGKSFVTVMDSSDTEESPGWHNHEICLSCDPRIHMSSNFIIQWRAAMDNPELGTEHDAAYVDDIVITATPDSPDVFGPITDLNDGAGHYLTSIKSFSPGTTWISASILSFDGLQIPIVATAPDYLQFKFRKVDPNSIRVIPEGFTIYACENLDFRVYGHYSDQPGTTLEDITQLYTFVADGPARISADGHLKHECILGSTPIPIKVDAIPLVPGLYDPSSEGDGIQTGYMDGKIFSSVFPYAAISGSRVRIEGSSNFSGTSGGDGSYFKSGVPVAGNYTVKALKATYNQASKTSVQVVAGSTTTTNLFQSTGSDTDGDTISDSYDTDDDGDGSTDGTESGRGTTLTDPDTDGDGYGDNVDACPTNAGEYLDTDGDTTCDNTDTDDDGDGISDTEENIPGADGYITNPKSADTDADGLGDYAEIHTYLTDPSKADTDGGGRNDGWEITNGRNPVFTHWNDDNYPPVANAGPDIDVTTGSLAYAYGNNSSDPDGDGLVYTWVKLAGPAGMTLLNPTTSILSFDATWSGVYTFSLQVKDNFTPQAWGTPDNVVVYVHSATPVDTDGDTINDIDEYYNPTTNVIVQDVTCKWTGVSIGLACWGEASGDGIYDVSDLSDLKKYTLALISSFPNVYPGDASNGDLTNDGVIDVSDISLLKMLTLGLLTSDVKVPTLMTRTYPGSNPTVPVGGTQLLTVKVKESALSTGEGGVGVVFTVSGPGTLLGGRGSASGLADGDGGTFAAGSRFDISSGDPSPSLANRGLASITVKVTGSGAITVNAKIPKDPSKYMNTSVYLTPVLTINP